MLWDSFSGAQKWFGYPIILTFSHWAPADDSLIRVPRPSGIFAWVLSAKLTGCFQTLFGPFGDRLSMCQPFQPFKYIAHLPYTRSLIKILDFFPIMTTLSSHLKKGTQLLQLLKKQEMAILF